METPSIKANMPLNVLQVDIAKGLNASYKGLIVSSVQTIQANGLRAIPSRQTPKRRTPFGSTKPFSLICAHERYRSSQRC